MPLHSCVANEWNSVCENCILINNNREFLKEDGKLLCEQRDILLPIHFDAMFDKTGTLWS